MAIQCSCLENPRDGAAWWAAVSGVTQSWTRLKRLSNSSSRGDDCSTGEGIGYPLQYAWVALVAQLVKNLPAMRETWVLSLGVEDPLEEGRAADSSILAWRIPMDRGAWQAAVHGVAKSRTRLSDFTFTFMHWRRKWQPSVLAWRIPGTGELVGCRLWGRTESDTTEATQQQQQQQQ